MPNRNQGITRRRFLEGTARGAGILAVSGGSIAVSIRQAGASPGKEVNPFALDVERLRKTDPKLIHYEEVRRFPCPGSNPRRIAIGSEGRIYVAGGDAVTVLDRGGAQVSEITCSDVARCVTVATEGTIYVGVRDHVEVFDRDGKRLAKWDAPNKRTWVSGLAVGANDVFAADSGNRIVLRYDMSGKLVGRIGKRNRERNIPGFIVPSPYLDVKLARDGLLWVNNTGRHRVEAYTVDGDLEFFWGKPSAAIDGFCGCCNPVGLALLPDGRCVTCEKGLPRVKVYSANGTFECVVAGVESFPENWLKCSLADCTVGGLDAAVDAAGHVYVLDLVNADVRVMARKKDMVGTKARGQN